MREDFINSPNPVKLCKTLQTLEVKPASNLN